MLRATPLTPADFVRIVFAGLPGLVSIWSGRTKRTTFVRPDEGDRIDGLLSRDATDLYVGVATLRAAPGGGKRGGAEEVASLPALWMDVDIVGPTRSSSALPATEVEARAFIESLPLRPSILVHTGGGFHGWWLLARPEAVGDPNDRQKAATASTSFQRGIIARGAERGWRLDKTADLARVLRLPGTFNGKTSPPTEVRVVEFAPERRYTLDELVAAFDSGAPDDADGDAESADDDEAILAAVDAGVPSGARDTTLFRYAQILRDGGTERNEAERLLVEAAGRCKPPFSEHSARAKVASVYKRQSNGGGGKRTIAELLIECADGVEFFHDDEQAFARVRIGSHMEVYRVPGRAFAGWLTRELYARHRKGATPDALSTASAVLRMRGIVDGQQRSVYLRVAETNDATYIDIGDAGWRAIEVTRDRWRILDSSPVMFIRPRGMRPLPVPISGGSIAELRRYVNLPDERQWMLFVGYLLACLRHSVPFPVLAVHGPQGSAKSTLVRIARSLVDPNQVPLRLPPGKVDDLIVSASKSWLLCFDNVSKIDPMLADAFCMVATGGGLSKRVLYTDDDEHLVEVKRAIILNGIEDLATRHDLADRTIVLSLPQIVDEHRRSARIEQEFDQARARIFGALLDGLVAALANEASFASVASVSRMHDFTARGMAAASAFGWDPNAFLDAHRSNRQEAAEQANDADVVVGAVSLLMESHAEWHGTASMLLSTLKMVVPETTLRSRVWPQAANALSQRLKRAEHGLRARGVEITFLARAGVDRSKPILLRRIGPLRPVALTAPTDPTGPHWPAPPPLPPSPAWPAPSSAVPPLPLTPLPIAERSPTFLPPIPLPWPPGRKDGER